MSNEQRALLDIVDRNSERLMRLVGDLLDVARLESGRLSLDREVLVEVEDTGVGIPAAEQARLFERFYRTPQAGALAISGTGVGLWTTREIVQAHGGTIDVRSDEGAGATFTVTLRAVEGALRDVA